MGRGLYTAGWEFHPAPKEYIIKLYASVITDVAILYYNTKNYKLIFL